MTQRIFSTSCTFTIPQGITKVRYCVWEPGGGGNGQESGEAGGYHSGEWDVTPGSTINIVVGKGGEGANGGGRGGDGAVLLEYDDDHQKDAK
jgi:hypothetical protein